MTQRAAEVLETVEAAPGLVIVMCGLAGSGKTTFSTRLADKGFVRLSIDEEVWNGSGRYGVDFEPADYPKHLEAARDRVRRRLIEMMLQKTPVVVDSAYWSRTSRDDVRRLIEQHGCTFMLIHMKAHPDVLRSRLMDRTRRFDANAPFRITDEDLERFMRSFEAPEGEGEIVVAG